MKIRALPYIRLYIEKAIPLNIHNIQQHSLINGGEGGIRTLDTGLPYTHFPGVLLQPLGHFSKTARKGKPVRFPVQTVILYVRSFSYFGGK